MPFEGPVIRMKVLTMTSMPCKVSQPLVTEVRPRASCEAFYIYFRAASVSPNIIFSYIVKIVFGNFRFIELGPPSVVERPKASQRAEKGPGIADLIGTFHTKKTVLT